MAATIFPLFRDEVGGWNNQTVEKVTIAVGSNQWVSPAEPDSTEPEEEASQPTFEYTPPALNGEVKIEAPTVIYPETELAFLAEGSGGTAPYTFAWTNYNGNSDGSKGGYQTFPAGNHTVSVRITDAEGATKDITKTFTVEPGYFVYDVVGGKAVITNYLGNNDGVYEVVIPEELGGAEVAEIGINSFGNKGLTSVVIPSTVTKIGISAFQYNHLTSVQFSEGLQSIGDDAFWRNNISDLSLPSTVHTIGNWAFQDNDLSIVEIPIGIQSIGEESFIQNDIHTVKIYNPSLNIGYGAFVMNFDTTFMTFYGHSGSTTEMYANDYGHIFQPF